MKIEIVLTPSKLFALSQSVFALVDEKVKQSCFNGRIFKLVKLGDFERVAGQRTICIQGSTWLVHSGVGNCFRVQMRTPMWKTVHDC